MSIAQRLVNLSDGLSADGVLSAAKGGTGTTTGGGTTSPTVSQISYLGDDTAADPSGGTTITLSGTNFASGAKVLINNTQVSVVTVVSSTQITFTAPQLAAGSYILYVVNLDGSTAIAVPGIQYSGTPAWSTPAGSLGTGYETGAVSATLSATSDSAVTYSVFSGTLPTGATLNPNGTISGTSPLVSGSTTYTFTVRATDAENQDTDREFSLTVNPDVVSWSSPTNGATLSATPNTAYSSNLLATSAAGSSISYSATSLPAGLSISGSTITGTPTAAGTSTTTLTATAATTSKIAQITINWTINIAADAYFKYTTLLLNSETAATPFIADASANNFALTVFGDTKPNNFNPYTPGYYSNYFDGNDWLDSVIPTTTVGTNNFTVECWVYPTAAYGSLSRMFLFGVPGAGYLTFFINASGQIVYGPSGGSVITTSSTVPLNTWTHIAISRSNGTSTVYINGVSGGTASDTTNFNSANNFYLGQDGSGNHFTGYISNFRLVIGSAVYTTAFTPPTVPLTAVTGTVLLTCQSNRVIDNSPNPFTITRNGDTKVSPFDPFVPNSSYATYGSTYFDGTGDTLSYTGGTTTTLSADFTLEAWINLNNLAANQPIMCIGDGYNLGALFFVDSAGKMRLYANNVQIFTGTITVAAGTWTHIAFVRSGSTITGYVNGVAGGTVTNSSQWSGTTTYIGREIYNTGTGIQLAGYISDLRLVKGTAVYTTNFTPPTVPLTAVSGTSLLTCQTNQPNTNSVFLDNSSNALAISRTGNATQGSFSPYGANWSNYFDGSGDYLTPSGNATIASGEFTIEAWVFPTAYSTPTNFIISDNNWQTGQNGGYRFYIKSDGKLELAASTATWNTYPVVLTSTSSVPLNQWSHVAITRNSSNVIRCFINGVQDATTVTYSAALNQSTAYQIVTQIGAVIADGGLYDTFTGYISNLRVVNGTGGCLYTAGFTPPTEPLTAVAGTKLLTCQSPNLVDNSLNAYTITKNGDVRVERFSPFATVTQTPLSHSVYFDGTGDYLSIADATNLQPGTGDFTYEFWWYPTTFAPSYQEILTKGTGLQIYAQSAGPYLVVALSASNSGTYFINSGPSTTLSTNTWYHIAVTRSGNNYYVYLNGTQTSLGTPSSSPDTGTDPLIIGAYKGPLYYTSGYISNVRFVKGTAVYTGNFTPSTTPLTAIPGTQLLTCQSPTIVDNSANAFTITAFGDARARKQNPFGSTTSSAQDYSPQTFGASGYFDGTDDKLTIANYPGLAFGTNDFTIQAWFYTVASSLEQVIATNGWSSYAPWLIRIDSGNTLRLNMSTSGGGWDVNEASLGTVVTNQWYHVAVTRKSGTIRAFVNGIQQYTTTLASSLYNGSQALNVAGRSDASVPLKGYLTDMQLVNGTALYTAGFVPPQAPLMPVQNTTLLLNMDRAAISDKSGKVVVETVGDAKLSTAVKKYGSASMYFDGTGDYLKNVATPLASLQGDFTVECWLYWTAHGNYGGIVSCANSNISTGPTSGWAFVFYSTTDKLYFETGSGFSLQTTNTIPSSQWNHVAVVRSGSTITHYLNGVANGSGTSSAAFNVLTTDNYVIGVDRGLNNHLTGYIDDLRITKGYARYTANFTPPTEALLTK